MGINDRFKKLTFDGFRKLAQDSSLSRYGKIGFPDSYRDGKEEAILADIMHKLTNLNKSEQLIIDIGPGCSGLAFLLIDLCRRNRNTLILIDSEEMLSHLPNESFLIKVPSRYPQECAWLFEKYAGRVNAILSYSVLQYVFVEASVFDFLDKSLELMADDAQMLIGDIPNISMRKRFFSSLNGVQFHQQFTGATQPPQFQFNTVETGNIDDAVVLSLVARCRNAGRHAFVVPQADDLPMANRREDILIKKP